MPLPLLLKSYLITSILASPKIITFFLPLLNKLANSNSTILNPDRNPVLHMIVRKFIYDHFIAGENATQVRARVKEMKGLGFSGVILGYAREVNVSGGEVGGGDVLGVSKEEGERAIREWRDGLMNTLSLLQPGDFLSLKFSGAGPLVLHALQNALPPPPLLLQSMHLLLRTAASQSARLWLDAEQQDLQPTIESWTIDLMRIYNTGSQALLYTTMQAYLKSTPSNILRCLQLAQKEDWVLGIKLVRGAYIATEKRELIWGSIEETHEAYNGIAAGLLSLSYPGMDVEKDTAILEKTEGNEKGKENTYPRAELFLATHNEESIKKAYTLQSSRILAGNPTIELAFGQLQGMADEISCSLLQLRRKESQESNSASPTPKNLEKSEEKSRLAQALKPKAYKCMVWGSTQQCLQFLLRRVKENGDALGRTGYWVEGFKREIWRRMRSASGMKRRKAFESANGGMS
ncbi:similar to proline oxidase [Botrytis cinerea T4]|nr:similar to proline oxidase [Botrytis cinerea T4]